MHPDKEIQSSTIPYHEQNHFMFEHISASHQATVPEDVKVDKRTNQYKLAHKLPPTGNKGECVAFGQFSRL
uniref:Uncharacterized protein n=1 Tax=Ditylenchus dipsaci TaxID=166011 RepID=A0A915CM95_9BILA